ncbi:hypothetical protein RHGRI_024862 [Rhododendron griersonianum]|uniref:Phytocyanin domain-containing protein n=1 Tax=Rhododendron griersonianum TaxID=479676 RepID=A0AAV6JG37_9ERIC|nr:hypothetical protein RHGRI_024862 [Rhododendron griersonianum]
MERNMRMAVFAFGVVAAVVLQCAAAQRAYVVGDNSLGWTIPPNGAEAPFTIGLANITLTSADDHYYICTYGSHCQMGQKLAITVSAAGTPGAAPSPSTTAPPPPPSTPSPTSGTTPEACAPAPSTTTPSAGGPTTTGQVPLPPPNSSSPAVFGGFFLTVLSIAVVALF